MKIFNSMNPQVEGFCDVRYKLVIWITPQVLPQDSFARNHHHSVITSILNQSRCLASIVRSILHEMEQIRGRILLSLFCEPHWEVSYSLGNCPNICFSTVLQLRGHRRQPSTHHSSQQQRGPTGHSSRGFWVLRSRIEIGWSDTPGITVTSLQFTIDCRSCGCDGFPSPAQYPPVYSTPPCTKPSLSGRCRLI